MNTIIEKIRTWVERQLKNTHDWLNGKGAKKGTPRYYEMRGRESAFDSVLSILSDLEKEEKPSDGLEEENIFANKDLNKEWKKFIEQEKKENHGDLPCYGDFGVLRIARHFAKWQKVQLMKDGNVILSEEDFDAEKEKSMERGYNLCKEQMMKEAVEGDIGMILHDKTADLFVRSKGYLPKSLGIKCDDKVRIIIVKED